MRVAAYEKNHSLPLSEVGGAREDIISSREYTRFFAILFLSLSLSLYIRESSAPL